MSQVYIYDGSFVSLLYLIYDLISKKRKPFQIKSEEEPLSLLEEPIYLALEDKKDILKIMVLKLGASSFRKIFRVFLSAEENKELILYYFILNAFKYPQTILKRRNLKCVTEVLRISDYVAHESHKMKGFLRFRELKNQVLYAEIAPTNNILYLITNHFQKRLPKECWIIKDVSRNIYAIYQKQKLIYATEEEFHLNQIKVSEEEIKIESLWKLFYRTTGIQERKNDTCRRNFMPKKYWQYITEVRDER